MSCTTAAETGATACCIRGPCCSLPVRAAAERCALSMPPARPTGREDSAFAPAGCLHDQEGRASLCELSRTACWGLRAWGGGGENRRGGVCAGEDLRLVRNGAWKASRHGTAMANNDSVQRARECRTMLSAACGSATARERRVNAA